MVGTGTMPSMTEYRKEQTRLRDLIEKQRQIAKKLAAVEETIAQKETNYLEATPNGNIIFGFDSYIKGINSAAQRKKQNAPDANRVFSRSSISYRPVVTGDATPGSSNPSFAATPTAYKVESGNATPTTSTGPAPSSGKAGKKKKAATVNDDDSEVDASHPRKRINFGSGRK
ncbi:Chromatin modification-related protein eaf6 [Ceratocystis fimbriata CBS 114723]|uniref:Chromatin modification-related protein EAF6 n=1 Tax=Ceratocystis fimbriata CBS 114723 TaxID=1035309 RepID=A0A2C5X480_9PEZI|nr:Chromatin modification-related protein eaf6 [Ceratocystis fimbriata CBS 114723]